MGIENNEAVIATTHSAESAIDVTCWISGLPEKHRRLFVQAGSWCNNLTTFLLAPCGSNKDLEEDREAEKLRAKFIEKLCSFDYDDGSSPFDWVEVGFGEFGQKVLRGNCKNYYTQEEYYTDNNYDR
jgi:hypothetical protein